MTTSTPLHPPARCARDLRLLPVGAIVENGIGEGKCWFRKTGDDTWLWCDATGSRDGVHHDVAGPYRSEAIFLPARVRSLPERSHIAQSLLAVALRRHQAVEVFADGEVRCVCSWRGFDHAAHQTEAVIETAITKGEPVAH